MDPQKPPSPLPERLKQVVVVGTGLLGASVGLALRRAGFDGGLVGVGRRSETLAAARRMGAIDRGTGDYAEALAGADLVIVAVPLSGFAEVFAEIARHDHPGLVVTDVGSTKVSVHAAAAALRRPDRFVGSHPMAGSEQRGPEAASADLLEGKPCIVTASREIDRDALALVEGLWRALGMTIVRMSPDEHDARSAAISHLPHAAAVALVQAAAVLGGWEIASTGFRDTTRLASSNPPMRVDILTANRDAVLAAMDCYRDQLDRLRQVLAGGDREALQALLEDSRQRRDRWVASRTAGD